MSAWLRYTARRISVVVRFAAGPEFKRKDAKLAKGRKVAEPDFARRARRFGY